MNTSHFLKIVLGQVAQPNGLKEILLPALLAVVNANRDISLLADSAAEATSLIPSSQMSESITQIVKLASRKLLGGHIVLEPQDLGDLHLNAHFATNILEELVLGAVDQFRFLNRAMVEPENNVAVVAIVGEIRSGDGHGFIGVGGEDGE